MTPAFRGDRHFLSNFYRHPVLHAGHLWPTAEHAYQAAKTSSQSWKEQILNAATPGEAKRLGRKVPVDLNWEEQKLAVMEAILRAKFARGSSLAMMLIGTGDEHLEETNWWGDRFWGTCNGTGKNHLGKLLMKIREDLR